MFRALGMALVADDEPRGVEERAPYVQGGRAFVAIGPDDRPVGYLLLELVDGTAYIAQVSVHPSHGRLGIGRALIERAATWGVEHGLPALTLTTFVTVPWNGPYYERLGFRYIATAQEPPGLREIRDRERESGLDAWPRACMIRHIP